MLLNRVLCVNGLYFSPFNDGLKVCVRVCMCGWVWMSMLHISFNQLVHKCKACRLWTPLEFSCLFLTKTTCFLTTAFNLDMLNEWSVCRPRSILICSCNCTLLVPIREWLLSVIPPTQSCWRCITWIMNSPETLPLIWFQVTINQRSDGKYCKIRDVG